MEKEFYIGVMSGTSLDGIDVALVTIDEHQTTLIAHYEHPIPAALKAQLLTLCHNTPVPIQTMASLDHQLGHLFADAVLALLQQYNLDPALITAIGNHGQTVFHQPKGEHTFTCQLGDANIIATKTGITTIADFRRKDMALGGQGAPLVPAFHQALFVPTDSSIVVANIGGIANISVLNPYRSVIGFDTGPGNMLMDAWANQHWQQPYDKDASFAQQGSVHQGLLTQLLTCDYFQRPAPKSTGRELFNLRWLEQQLEKDHAFVSISAYDIQATLCELTAVTMAKEIAHCALGSSPELLICGGGAHNPLLMARLQALLPNWVVTTTTQRGVNGDYMEAMAFAWLARQCCYQRPSNLPDVTGACARTSLGVIYPPACPAPLSFNQLRENNGQ